jgi:hypothetical protein
MLTTIPPPAERRIRREARSETLRERALALRDSGWTLAAIGGVLGVSDTRAGQLVYKAERRRRNPHWSDSLRRGCAISSTTAAFFRCPRSRQRVRSHASHAANCCACRISELWLARPLSLGSPAMGSSCSRLDFEEI